MLPRYTRLYCKRCWDIPGWRLSRRMTTSMSPKSTRGFPDLFTIRGACKFLLLKLFYSSYAFLEYTNHKVINIIDFIRVQVREYFEVIKIILYHYFVAMLQRLVHVIHHTVDFCNYFILYIIYFYSDIVFVTQKELGN